jgi:toxin ParE1/3/4
LAEHFAYIARDKIAPADRFLKVAEESFQRLADTPGIGRAWESSSRALHGIRLYPMPSPYSKYLIFYRLADDQAAEILAVLHGARDIGNLMGDIT